MTEARTRGGAALTALVFIILVSVGWWAFALWPVPDDVPEWVLRTRAACFGKTATGLPHAGGWILLIGEPVGFMAVLAAGWRHELVRDLAWLRSSFAGRSAMIVTGLLLAFGLGAAGQRVRTALRSTDAALFVPAAFTDDVSEAYFSREVPSLALQNQHGIPFSLESLRGKRVAVTFAFAHCGTVCPMIVHDLHHARQHLNADDIAIVIVTVDPWRDTPSRLKTIAEQWELGPGDHVLSGSIDEVLGVLAAWEVSISRDELTGDIAHVPLTGIIDREGKLRYRTAGDWKLMSELLESL